ncbi:hypothetical protein D0T84_05565 [Dysgonomonas sp. 521]|uniref:PL29 family lyase N-terminal domain-containing protein n=1 Tax=Dysgonomonas sp. 521 TaxID=2302932 RepID=UPI0013D10764|nr:PL29 family lyase N-terminal domain-containing protein [Dysgonomonas sp. 521]NDV94387.1 hypothetical protein [Dysgonomonas sp. 521]
MKKQFFSVLLCGAVIFSAGTFSSCGDDVDDLKSRVSVLEVAVEDLKNDLSKAITTGASIISVEETNGTYKLVLSDGKTITIKTGSGGGSDVTVEINDSNAIITVNGTEYVLPLGSSVNSLIYSPETVDGIVTLGNAGADVSFLATPAISSSDLAKATFDIAEAHELKAGGNGLFKVDGEATLDGDFLKVKIKGLGVEAGKTYAVSLLMSFNGTAISSNYFTVKVDDDFSFASEDIGGFTIKAAYSPKVLENASFSEMTINGRDLLKLTNFKDLFDELPANATFSIAGKQPEGAAQDKKNALSDNLAKDGAWAMNTRLGSSFNDSEDRKGFLFNVIADDVVKAKIYVMINDELADVDLTGQFTDQAEAEWGGRDKSLPLGAQTINIQKGFANYETDYPIIHGGANEFFANWATFEVKKGDEPIVYSDGTKLVLGDLAKEYATGCRGLYWFYRGFAIYVPEALATTDGKYVDENGKSWSGAEGFGYDFWLGQYNEYIDNPSGFYPSSVTDFGITIDEATGSLNIPDSYTGYGFRIGIGAGYEYAYGVKRIGAAEQLGLFFFNRRLAPDGATMPAPQP